MTRHWLSYGKTQARHVVLTARWQVYRSGARHCSTTPIRKRREKKQAPSTSMHSSAYYRRTVGQKSSRHRADAGASFRAAINLLAHAAHRTAGLDGRGHSVEPPQAGQGSRRTLDGLKEKNMPSHASTPRPLSARLTSCALSRPTGDCSITTSTTSMSPEVRFLYPALAHSP